MTVVLHLYTGDPPSLEELYDRTGVDRSATYLTANSALERRRLDEGFHSDSQCDSNGAPVLAFTKAVREIMRRPTLSRTEERVLFRRAVADLGLTTQEAARLRRDARQWVEALAQIDAQGFVMGAEGLTSVTTTPQLALLIAQVGAAFQSVKEQTPGGRLGLERTVRQWIEEGGEPIQHLVMEGFTFLTPLQRLLISSVSQRSTVHIVVPYRESQPRLFEQVRQTYDQWWDDDVDEWPTEVAGKDSLVAVQHAIFAGTGYPLSDDALTAVEHPHVHDEVRACVGQIAECLSGGVPPQDIAVVVPSRQQFDGLLQEEASLQDLPVSVGVPPRLLLLTPVGRFILALYNTAHGGEVELTEDQFEMMLSSGWLGALAQRSVHEFRAVKNQLFARCRSIGDWEQVLDDVEARPSQSAEPSRQAIDWVDGKDLVVWRDALAEVVRLIERLFEPGEWSIGEHVQRLLEAIDEMPDEQILQGEREIIARVRDALSEATDSVSLGVGPDEFADVLTSLATEYEEATTTEEEALREGRIWVTTPEGIDGVRRRVVFVLGMDTSKMPRPFNDGWPFQQDVPLNHLRRERYMFGSAIRAGLDKVHISCARRTLDTAEVPTPLLPAAGLSVIPVAQNPSGVIPTVPSQRRVIPAKREQYTITELAHFGLCPYRYKLERLEPRSRRFTSPIHVPLLAQGRWIDLTLQRLERNGTYLTTDLLAAVHEAADAVRDEVYRQFPALSAQDRRTTEARVAYELRTTVDWLVQRAYPVAFQQAPPIRFPIDRRGRVQFVEATVRHAIVTGRITRPFTNDLVHEEWLRPERKAPMTLEPSVEDLRLFVDRAGAFTWWQESLRAAHGAMTNAGRSDIKRQYEAALRARLREADELIQQLEAGRFPRRPGDHCSSCPVLDDCLGLDP